MLCKHCKKEIAPCQVWPTWCKGWIHVGYNTKPMGRHYCDGRIINPLAEPEEDVLGNVYEELRYEETETCETCGLPYDQYSRGCEEHAEWVITEENTERNRGSELG